MIENTGTLDRVEGMKADRKWAEENEAFLREKFGVGYFAISAKEVIAYAPDPITLRTEMKDSPMPAVIYSIKA